jgi:ABC-type anion transport system duplicated permease subunit
VLMSALVVTFNRLVWKRLHHLAETKFSLSK